MHSFSIVSALLVAALASLTNAAPITVAPASVGQVSGLIPGVAGVPAVGGVVTTVEGQVTPVAGSIVTRDVASTVKGAVDAIESKIQTRKTASVAVSTGSMSVAAIFSNLQTEIVPYTSELKYLTSSNFSVSQVTTIISNIKAPIATAIPQLQALAGQPTSVIFGAVDGSSTLSVTQVATYVTPVFTCVLSAAGTVVNIAGVQSDVTTVVAGLIAVVSTLLSVVVSLVAGILSELSPVLAPVMTVLSSSGLISVLGLNSVAALLGLGSLSL